MLTDYYGRRAREYEAIYRRQDPVAQAELARICASLQAAVRDREVLEVACGTGYWTVSAAKTARHITAIDASREMLAVAAEKCLPPENASFHFADAYALARVAGTFDAGIALFWLSHVPVARLDEFLLGFHQRLELRAQVFLADNVYVPGLGGDLVHVAGEPDTYKVRTLGDGTVYHVLKNYFQPDRLTELLGPRATDLRLEYGERYWWASYEVRSNAGERSESA